MKPRFSMYIMFIGKSVMWVMGIIAIIMLLLKLTGHSPTEIQILYVIVGGILSYLLIMGYKLGRFVGETRTFMAISKNSFRKINQEFEILRKDIASIKNNYYSIREDLSSIKKDISSK